MAINPYTLQMLYEKGILNYVPYDLMGGMPISPMMTNEMNPYLQMASQGGLYQNYGAGCDSFSHSSNYNTPVYGTYSGYNNFQQGSHNNNSLISAYSPNGMGTVQRSPLSMFGNPGYGAYNRSNALGISADNIGTMSNASPIAGFEDVTNGISDGVNKTANFIDRTPKLIKNIAAAGIGLLGIMYLFKRGRKPKNIEKTGFWSKLNPMNWKIFKKK